MHVAPVVLRLPRNVLVAVLALVALLQPTMTPLAPDLAGRLPNHGHIYASGAPIPHHHHPGDPRAQSHHDPSTPGHNDATDTNAVFGAAPDATAGVVFTFEGLSLFASLMPPTAPLPPPVPDAVAAPAVPVGMRPSSLVIAPASPPPQG